jgi:phage shock protein A
MRDTFTLVTEFISELLQRRPGSETSLDQSIAAAGAAHIAARRALAIAVAEETREIARRDSLVFKVSDLEHRAIAAIRAGRDDLALAAAEAIASIRTEIEASEQASSRFADEVALARREVDAQRRRLAELDRGRRLARIGSALNAASPSRPGHDVFAAAELALEQVNTDNADARAVRDEMVPQADRLIERLSNDGFGRPVAVRATDVMARLRMMAAMPVLIESEVETGRKTSSIP